MAHARLVEGSLWTGATGNEWRRLGHAHQVLGHYLFTSPAASIYGLYRLPLPTLIAHTGIHTTEEARAILLAMARQRYAFYDAATEWVWIVTMAMRQLRITEQTPITDLRVQGAQRWYADLPANPFLGPFYGLYGRRLRLAAKREGPPWTPPGPMSDEERRALFLLAPPDRTPLRGTKLAEQCFDEWWRHYPKRVGKLKALRAWLKIRPLPDAAFTSHAIAAAQQQAATPEWLKEGGAFIPYPATWLNAGRWMDEPIEMPLLSSDDAENIAALQQWATKGERHAQK